MAEVVPLRPRTHAAPWQRMTIRKVGTSFEVWVQAVAGPSGRNLKVGEFDTLEAANVYAIRSSGCFGIREVMACRLDGTPMGPYSIKCSREPGSAA